MGGLNIKSLPSVSYFFYWWLNCGIDAEIACNMVDTFFIKHFYLKKVEASKVFFRHAILNTLCTFCAITRVRFFSPFLENACFVCNSMGNGPVDSWGHYNLYFEAFKIWCVFMSNKPLKFKGLLLIKTHHILLFEKKKKCQSTAPE